MKQVYTLFRIDADTTNLLETLRSNLHPMPSKNELVRLLMEKGFKEFNLDGQLGTTRWVGVK